MLSETEVEVLRLDGGVLLGGFGLKVNGIALNVDCLDRADEFTAAATYAQFRGGFGNGQAALERNHVDGLNRAVLSTGTAAGAVHVNHADILIEYYTARLGMTLLLYCERTDGSGRANLTADGTTIVAVAFIKLHNGLH